MLMIFPYLISMILNKSNQNIHIIYPSAISINPSGNRLYAASKNTNSVTIFDIANIQIKNL